MPFWSSISITGKPNILLVDASGNINRWESAFCNRLFQSLQRSNLTISKVQELHTLKDQESFNCLLLCTHTLKNDWDYLEALFVPRKLIAVCTWASYDPDTTKQILGLNNSPAAAIVPQSETTAREAGLFYLKFFTELDLHSADEITGKMIWFSFAKAKELLKRRRYTAKFSVRC